MTTEQGISPNEVDFRIAAAISSPAFPVIYSGPGSVALVSPGLRFRAKVPCTIFAATIDVGTAPTSGTVIADAQVNGASIFASAPHRPQLTTGLVEDDGQIDTTSMAVDDVLTISITSAGVGAALVTVTIWLQPLPLP